MTDHTADHAAAPPTPHRPGPLATLRRLLTLALCLALSLGAVSSASGAETAPAAALATDGVAGALDSPVESAMQAASNVRQRSEDVVDEVASAVDCLRGFAFDPVAGCLRDHGDGLSDLQLLDGSTVTVTTPHAHDHGEPGDDTDADQAEGSTSATRLDNPRRRVACAPRHTHRTVVLYAHRPGQSRMGPRMRGVIRETMERSNFLVARSARESGGPLTKLRFACAKNNRAISIPSIESNGTSYAQLQDAARRAGFTSDREKYLIFADVPSPKRNVAGMAQIHRDDRRTLTNRNNQGNMYGVVWAGNFRGRTPLHELSHMMGAVQPSAPTANGSFHCTDSRDVLCYSHQARACGTYKFDCRNNSYFSTNPRAGSYLAKHWNLGWAGNRFINVAGRPTPNVAPTARFDASCTTATCRLDARGSSDVDGFIRRAVWQFGDGQSTRGRTSSHTYRENGTYTVTLTVTDNRGATDTTTQQVTVRNQRPVARINVDCDARTCSYDGSGSTDADGTVAAWRWEVDGRTRRGRGTSVSWPSDGTYTVALSVLDNDGWSSSRTTQTVTVCGTEAVLGEVACQAGGLVDQVAGDDTGTRTLEPLRDSDPVGSTVDATVERAEEVLSGQTTAGDGSTAGGLLGPTSP